MRTGTAHLPLHRGSAPRWLTQRMARLGRAVVEYMVSQEGTSVVLRRLSDPFWFQALGCVLGFDWHSSGVTTTVCGALKEGLKGTETDLGLYVCGGKGGRSRRTPGEVQAHCWKLGRDAAPLVRASRLAAKIDSVALQDGFQLYHHALFFDRTGAWCVVQQGMADERDALGYAHRGYARRYHWLGSSLTSFVEEPHSAICCEQRGQLALDLTARASRASRAHAVSLLRELSPAQLLAEVSRLPSLKMARRHEILRRDIHPSRVKQTLLRTYADPPATFLDLVGRDGFGARTMRALALVSELVHGEAPSFVDPARYSFAHGGKDGIPYPVDRATYDQTMDTLKLLVDRSRMDHSEKVKAFARLGTFDRERVETAQMASRPVSNATSKSPQKPASTSEM